MQRKGCGVRLAKYAGIRMKCESSWSHPHMSDESFSQSLLPIVHVNMKNCEVMPSNIYFH